MSELLPLVNVIDVESTCWEGGWKAIPPGQRSEIIEIGICVVDLANASLADTATVLVKPAASTVSAFCTELTSLTPAMLADGISFAEACRILRREHHSRDRLWVSYGDYDRVQFQRNCEATGTPYPFGRRHLNLKAMLGLLRQPPGETDLMAALAEAGLSPEGRHHRGIDDAINTARLLLWMLRGWHGAVKF